MFTHTYAYNHIYGYTYHKLGSPYHREQAWFYAFVFSEFGWPLLNRILLISIPISWNFHFSLKLREICCVNGPQFYYPFICWWPTRLAPLLCYYEMCSNNTSIICVSLQETGSLGGCPGVVQLNHLVALVLNVWEPSMLISSMTALVCIPTL